MFSKELPGMGVGILGSTSADSCKLIAACAFWYVASSFGGNLAKQILIDFDRPVTLTLVQFIFTALSCSVYVFFDKGFSFSALDRKLVWSLLPISSLSLLGHLLSSFALSNISVSLQQTVKAGSPFLSVVITRIFLRQNVSRNVYLSLFPLMFGVTLTCYSDVSFHLAGFVLALLSALAFVVQSVFASKILHEVDIRSHEYLQCASFVSAILTFPVFCVIDLPDYLSIPSTWPAASVICLFAVEGLVYSAQSFASVTVLGLVGPVSFAVASLLKRVFVILTSIVYFRLPVTLLNVVGLVLTFVGVYLYNIACRVGGVRASDAAELSRSSDRDDLVAVS